MLKNITRVLTPKSIAIIGGGAWGENIILRAHEFGFKGKLLPVHPKKDEIQGIATVKSVKELEEVPDIAFIAVNRIATVDVVQELADMGCGGVICFASGFAEAEKEHADGPQLQQKLITASGDMPLFGPNCYGFINAIDQVAIWPDVHGLKPVERGVAILSQSSNIALNITMQQRSLPIGFTIAVGNQAKISLAHVALSLIEDKRITAIGCYIEGIDNVTDWQQLAKRSYELGKPIIALKAGASEQAQLATKTHTGSLAGSHAGFKALFRKLGIVQKKDIAGFLETLKIAHHCGWIESADIAAMCCSGGEASLIADLAEERGVTFPALPQDIDEKLYQVLGDRVARANPLDYHTYIWGNYEALKAAYSAMVNGPWAFTLLILDYPKVDFGTYRATIDAIIDSAKSASRPVGVIASMGENMPEKIGDELAAKGVVPISGFCEGLDAIRSLVRPLPNFDDLLPPPRISAGETLCEFEAKQILQKAGLSIPKGFRAEGTKALEKSCQELNFPLVLKGMGFAHKTEHQAVKIGLSNTQEVLQAAETMPSDTFLIEEMVKDTVCELLIGVVLDPSHGYILTVGAGGVMTELLRDTACVVLPAKRDELARAIEKLAIAPILHGYRGKAGIHMQALLDFLENFCRLITAHHPETGVHHIVECEINPLLCTTTNVVAVDALIIEGKKDG